MKRFVASFLVCILAVTLSIPTVRASSVEEDYFNVLEFSTANDSGSQLVSGSLPLSVVYRTSAEPFRYIDMVVTTDIPDLTVTYAGLTLTTLFIGGNNGYTYRVYGNLVGDPSGYLTLTFNGSSGSVVIFEQLRVSSFDKSMSVYPTVAGLYAYPATTSDITYMDDHSTPVRKYFRWLESFTAEIYLSDWKKYDFLDVLIEGQIDSIHSITCSIDNMTVPAEISYISTGVGDTLSDSYYGTVDGSVQSGTLSPPIYGMNVRLLIRLDFRNVDRTINVLPAITLRGYQNSSSNVDRDDWIQLSKVTGILVADNSSSLGTFWKNLQGFLAALFGTDPGTSDEMEQNNSDIKDFDDYISNQEKPNPDDFTPDQDLQESGASFDAFANFFLAVMENPFIYYGIFLSITLSVAGVILYGKR